MSSALLIVAHGTRRAEGVAMLQELRGEVARRLPWTEVRLAFVDVLGPTPEEALRELPGRVVIVPAFLASGYHVRTDLPRQVRRSAHQNAVIAPALGPDPVLAEVLAERLRAAGWDGSGQVVLAVAGTNDSSAQAENRTTLRQLEEELAATVRLGTIAQGAPRVDTVVEECAGPVFVAQYLLADGFFSRKLAELAAGARGIAAPLGTHPLVVDLLVRRYRAV
ncbi:MAG: sirohydrochlorin chelatase [Segniliparus sp.]|uniref:sirohydrochlorin chelatase n=1 Tax=Segniliparus sp. TaxID=2804064 RepID=UPI003F349F4F